MAEDNIDKALPNEPRKEFEIPGEEQIQEQVVEEVEKVQESPDDVEVTENEDGSVDINLDPAAASPEGGDVDIDFEEEIIDSFDDAKKIIDD